MDEVPYMTPEQIDPSLLQPRKHRVLVLASYCDDDGCTDDWPCMDCLKMCNVANAVVSLDEVIGGFGYLSEIQKATSE